MTGSARRHPRAPDDLVQPFQIEASRLRGRLVRLGRTVDEVLTRHNYPEPVATVLAEALACLLDGVGRGPWSRRRDP